MATLNYWDGTTWKPLGINGANGAPGATGGTAVSATIGDGTNRAFSVVHNLATKAVQVSGYLTASPWSEVTLDVERVDGTSLIVRTKANSPPIAAGSVTVVVSAAGSSPVQSTLMDGWHTVGAAGEPAFQNSWVAWGAEEALVQFRKGPDGKVHLRGGCKSGVATQTMFTLPAGYRPPQYIRTFVQTNMIGYGQLEVHPDGAVSVQGSASIGGAGGYCFMDSVVFDSDTVTAVPTVTWPQVPTVTALPAGPSDGQECYFLADATLGVKWHLVYRAASASPYKWECVSGACLRANLLGVNVTALGAGYASLSTPLRILAPVGGEYEAQCYTNSFGPAGGTVIQDCRLMCLGLEAPDDSLALYGLWGSTSDYPVWTANVSPLKICTVAAGGYINTLGKTAANWNIGTPGMWVRPVRVG